MSLSKKSQAPSSLGGKKRKEASMAGPVTSNNSASALFLAYALVSLSLCKLEMGLVRRSLPPTSQGTSSTSASFSSFNTRRNPRLHPYPIHASVKHFGISSSGRPTTSADNEMLRRIATLAVMAHGTGRWNKT